MYFPDGVRTPLVWLHHWSRSQNTWHILSTIRGLCAVPIYQWRKLHRTDCNDLDYGPWKKGVINQILLRYIKLQMVYPLCRRQPSLNSERTLGYVDIHWSSWKTINLGELVQGILTESTSYGDRLLNGHSQCLMSRMVIHDHHQFIMAGVTTDQPGKWPGKCFRSDTAISITIVYSAILKSF